MQILDTPFNPAAICDELTGLDEQHGALVTFTGMVRDLAEKPVNAIANTSNILIIDFMILIF